MTTKMKKPMTRTMTVAMKPTTMTMADAVGGKAITG